MHLWIVGAGSMGLLFGAYTSPHMQTTLVTRRREQARALQEDGLIFSSIEDKDSHCYVKALYHQKASGSHIQSADVEHMVLVTVKQTEVDEVITWVKTYVPKEVPVLFLLNGLGHVEKAKKRLANHQIYIGSTQSGAVRISDRQVKERGRGKMIIGASFFEHKQSFTSHPTSGFTVLCSFMDVLKKQGLHVEWSEEIEVILWQKCIINACINPLTALFGVTNGQLVEDVNLRCMMERLYTELEEFVWAAYPYRARDIMRSGKLWSEIKEVCQNTRLNYSSMLQDIQAGRKTEIESINGYFLSIADKHGMDLPAQKMAYLSVQFLQSHSSMSYYT